MADEGLPPAERLKQQRSALKSRWRQGHLLMQLSVRLGVDRQLSGALPG